MPNHNPSGMNASLKEAVRQQTPTLPTPTMALTINPKGYRFQLKCAKRQRLLFQETISETAYMLQVGGVVFVCFPKIRGACL